ncbi:MAG: response regulator [Pseudomonadota bacterium]
MNPNVNLNDKTVLVVEDELFLAEKISEQLFVLGVKEVLTATNLNDAEKHIQDDQIDLALLDVNLPNGDTTAELGKCLAAENVPVVFFSGYSASELVRKAAKHEFLEKPLSLPRLKASMHRAVVRASSLQM